jgi:ubiquinol-cytochrome c reductase cytochrome c subunit
VVRLLTHKLSHKVSAKRRSRFAGPAVLLIGLLMTGGLYAAFAPANAGGKASDADDVAKGRQLFLVGCASCHGKNAEGIVTKRGTNYGPSLVGVGAAAVDFQVGTGRMPMAQPGSQALEKPSVYTEEEIRQLGAYVASLGPGPSIPTEDQYDPEGLSEEEIAEGGLFFRTNCTACHNFTGSGGAMPQGKHAPDIRGVDPKHIFEAMATGPQQMPVFGDDVLTPDEKREIIGYVKSLNAKPGYGGFGLGSLGPVSEGMFAWIVGIGGLVLFAIWIAAHTTRSKRKVDA